MRVKDRSGHKAAWLTTRRWPVRKQGERNGNGNGNGNSCVKRRSVLPALGTALILVLQAVTTAHGHEFWLRAQPVTDGSEKLSVSAFVGEGLRGTPVRYSQFATHRLNVLGPNSVELPGREGHGKWTYAQFDPSEPGLVLYESKFSEHEMEREAFVDYLHTDGLEAILAGVDAGAGVVRERYRRSAKLWTGGREKPGSQESEGPGVEHRIDVRDSAVVRRTDLVMDIVPSKDPVSATGDVAFRVIYEGQPLAHCLVRAWCTDGTGAEAPSDRPTTAEVPIWRGRTDERGEVVMPVDRKGEWMVTAVHMVPSASSDHDWDSTWSSLSFLR